MTCLASFGRWAHQSLRSSPGRQRTGFPAWRVGGLVLLLWLLLLGHPGLLHAQDEAPQEQMYRVETVNGDVLIGTIVSETEVEVVINTRRLGTVTLDRARIESLEEIDPSRIRDGQYWFENPQSTRHFFSPNAIGIPEGQGYYQNTWVLFNNVNYGISDQLSIGAGTVPVFLFGANVFPFWVLPKLSLSTPQENFHVAGGAVLGGVLGEESRGIGLLYGSSTIGTRDDNVTLGVGYGYQGGSFSRAPAINVSGMTRIGRTFYFLSENYVFPNSEVSGLLSAGIRWAPENFAVDFGLFRPLFGDGDFIAFPWLGVSIPFGQ